MKKRLIFITLIALVCIIVSILLFAPKTSKDVFIENANKCSSDVYYGKISSLTIKFQILPDCTLVKTVVGINSDEPDRINKEFSDAEMKCTYEIFNFNPLHLEKLTIDMNSCYGTLKDNIDNVILENLD